MILSYSCLHGHRKDQTERDDRAVCSTFTPTNLHAVYILHLGLTFNGNQELE